MSSRHPTTVGFSLETLARRGGREGPHKDGWGVAYFEEHDVFLLRETRSASDSGLVQFMEQYGPPSRLVISHIRLATRGDPVLWNTHPFQRELGGRAHVFAHNGNLEGVWDHCALQSSRFTPIGDTDSEFVFCCLLEQLVPVWSNATEKVPSVESRLEIVSEFAERLRPLGPFNFVYSDGDTLFVHAHRRNRGDGVVEPPGLHMLVHSCNEQGVDLTESGVILAPTAQELTLIASVPLTDEPWEPLPEGEIIALKQGTVRARQAARAPAEA